MGGGGGGVDYNTKIFGLNKHGLDKVHNETEFISFLLLVHMAKLKLVQILISLYQSSYLINIGSVWFPYIVQ